ncbi:MAG: glutathione peroxidase [Myxococcales bacterium]|nr:glutathione peroxidase [Myxococcales bacterium]
MRRSTVALVFLSLLASLACGGADEPAPADKPAPTPAAEPAPAPAKEIDLTPSGPPLEHAVTTIDGEDTTLAAYRGKTLLIVNTASECGFTPQYEGLQKLYDQYKARGFEVLGFPCNDFGGQEPGDEATIKEFCAQRFQVSFPMFSKLHAKGPEVHALYKTLTEETREGVRGEIKWNFTKFLVNPEGRVVARFDTKVDPLDPTVTGAIERVLSGGAAS